MELFVKAEHVNTELQVNVQQDQLLDAVRQLQVVVRQYIEQVVTIFVVPDYVLFACWTSFFVRFVTEKSKILLQLVYPSPLVAEYLTGVHIDHRQRGELQHQFLHCQRISDEALRQIFAGLGLQ